MIQCLKIIIRTESSDGEWELKMKRILKGIMILAATAALCVFIFGDAMIKKLERIKIKYGIYR